MKTLKHLLLLSINIYISNSSQAQGYLPLLQQTDRVWNMVSWTYLGGNSHDESYYSYQIDASKDTIISGIRYRKFKSSWDPIWEPKTNNYFSEDTVNQVVYMHDSSLTETHILYDFNMEVGDTIDWVVPYEVRRWDSLNSTYVEEISNVLEVTQVETKDFNGIPRKEIILRGKYITSHAYSFFCLINVVWVEGVGSNYSPLGFDDGDCHYGATFIECLRDSNNYIPIYGYRCTPLNAPNLVESTSALKLYPNPVENTLNIYCPSQIKAVNLYSSSGQLLFSIGGQKRNELDIDMYSALPGVYLMEVNTTNESFKKKIIKH